MMVFGEEQYSLRPLEICCWDAPVDQQLSTPHCFILIVNLIPLLGEDIWVILMMYQLLVMISYLWLTSCIYKFTWDGDYISRIGNRGDMFCHPLSITEIDLYNKRIKIFSDYQLLLAVLCGCSHLYRSIIVIANAD